MNAKTLINAALIGFGMCASLSALAQESFQAIPVQDSGYLSSTTELDFYAVPQYVISGISDGTLSISFAASGSYLPPMAGEGKALYYEDEYLPGHDLYMNFSRPARTFGLWIEVPERASPITETFYNGTTMLGSISETAGIPGNATFFAAQTDGTGFTSVEIYDPSSPAGYLISDISYAVVPEEPSTMFLMGIGTCGVFGLLRLWPQGCFLGGGGYQPFIVGFRVRRRLTDSRLSRGSSAREATKSES